MKTDLGGVTLHYEVAGQGASLLLSHGVIENSASWEDVVGPLAGRFRVLTYDARGRGASSGGDAAFGYAELADDVEARARHLGLDSFIHVGHSMGGRVVLEHAVRYPQRIVGLVTISARAEAPSAAGKARLEALIESVRNDGSGAGVDMWTSPSDTYYSRARALSEANPVGGTMQALAALVAMDSFVPRLESIGAPALVVAGDRDVDYLHSAQVMAEKIPGASLEVLAGVGHFPNLECPDLLAMHIGRFADQYASR
jgi:pimeloyl-ACP methyl ester carboxylesterase